VFFHHCRTNWTDAGRIQPWPQRVDPGNPGPLIPDVAPPMTKTNERRTTLPSLFGRESPPPRQIFDSGPMTASGKIVTPRHDILFLRRHCHHLPIASIANSQYSANFFLCRRRPRNNNICGATKTTKRQSGGDPRFFVTKRRQHGPGRQRRRQRSAKNVERPSRWPSCGPCCSWPCPIARKLVF
jgi:hypothetical protein